ncbi:MAG: glycosyltransferase family 4 protein [Anaerolineales bacterium]|nr:glycosyltransferase family 4 protein [Anaerolineales bacterium]MCB8952390.1 glycosyltransferase family 4 protein [Ardenticatenales bacterium]
MSAADGPRLAFVVQRYGADVNGGAEQAARALAEHLTALADVHVITTCARDYTTWANVYAAGESQVNGVTVHRFPVDRQRDWRRAARRTNRLLHQEHTLADEVAWVRAQGPYSSPLLRFVAESADRFDLFVFVTYVYATTFFGLPLVAHKAVLLPTAHDEPYLYLPAFIPLFRQPQLIIHLTEPERDLVRRVIGPPLPPQLLIGLGLDAPAPDPQAPARFRQKYGIEEDFLLYAGRVTEAKNVPQLLDFFHRYRARHLRPLKLVLLGRAHMSLPAFDDVLPLGFVSEEDKHDAMQAATVFVMPSAYESLSIVCLEAWHAGTPVLANGACDVLKHQCVQSGGGLYYTSYDEFQAALNRLLASADLRRRLGAAGQAFVRRTYHWPVVRAQYAGILRTLLPATV